MTGISIKDPPEFTDREKTGVDELPELEPGTRVTVHAIKQGYETVFAGHTTEIVAASQEDAFEQSGIDPTTDERSYSSAIHIQGDVLWSISDGEIHDISHRVRERPPYRIHMGDDPREPPECSLAYGNDGTVGLFVPSPVSNGKRVVHYEPGFQGPIVDIKTGLRVTADELLPDGYERPD